LRAQSSGDGPLPHDFALNDFATLRRIGRPEWSTCPTAQIGESAQPHLEGSRTTSWTTQSQASSSTRPAPSRATRRSSSTCRCARGWRNKRWVLAPRSATGVAFLARRPLAVPGNAQVRPSSSENGSRAGTLELDGLGIDSGTGAAINRSARSKFGGRPPREGLLEAF